MVFSPNSLRYNSNMKIISLNIAGRSNFGQDFDARMHRIAEFLDREQADVVCMQEVTFYTKENLAERINRYMEHPYKSVVAHMSEKYSFDKFTVRFLERWNAGLVEHEGDFVTDGMAVLTNLPIANHEVITMTPAPADDRGKPDVRVRVSQILDFGDFPLANVHFATNHNAYMQLQELISSHPTDIVVGDFNIHTHKLQEHRDIWASRYQESTDFKDYISFPEENATFDHMLLSPKYSFVDIEAIEGLSDHTAMIYTVEPR